LSNGDFGGIVLQWQKNQFVAAQPFYSGIKGFIPVQRGLAEYKVVCANMNWFFPAAVSSHD
jgi:hypothetical protein